MKGKKDRVVAIVPAAGIGKRFGYERNKPFYPLSGKPLIIWALEALQSAPEIAEIIPVMKEEDLITGGNLIEEYNITKVKRIVPGGRERQDSVCNGIRMLGDNVSVVVIHDGVRPLVDKDLISKCIADLAGFDGVIAGVPVKDTVKEVRRQKSGVGNEDENIVQKTLDREAVWAIQTPQVFKIQKIREAYERAVSEKYYATDDAALLERCAGSIKVIMGSYKNIKITTPEDICVAEALLKMRNEEAKITE
ncbi:MAG: 2-C-methyl-D-erythritol 4-phosphate cytidylyltransferase [Thermodesulfovibrionales bacterium]|nr:2-C-methyl-D-erythritol 4-phosphate cytidylyltransferase [Thermodesulfovibrionales bacterium]